MLQRMNISVIPSALGTSNLIPYLPCVILTSGVTSQPRRLMWCTGSAPWAASSRDLYKVRWRSRHVNQNCFGCFSVNRFGLNKQTNKKKFTSVNIYIKVWNRLSCWFCLKTIPNFKQEKLQNDMVLLPVLQNEVSLKKYSILQCYSKWLPGF